MKKLLIGLLALISLSASAKTIELFSQMSGFSDEIEPTFMFNEDLGRAWVNIVTVQDWGDDADENDNFVKVEGLSFNKETREVEYTDGAKVVVCASFTTRGRGLFRNTSLRNSEKCYFSKKVETKSVDDGFYVRVKKYDVVSLIINL